MKTNLSFFLLNVLKILIFLLSIWFLSNELSKKMTDKIFLHHIKEQISNTAFLLYTALSFILMPLNWFIEAFKWKIATQRFFKTKILKILYVIFVGVALDLFFPSRLGDVTAKIISSPEGQKWQAVVIQFYVSLGQLIVITLFATIFFIFIFFSNLQIMQISTIVVTIVSFIMLLFFTIMFFWSTPIRLFIKLIKMLIANFQTSTVTYSCPLKERLSLLTLSALRYFIYAIQFHLIFLALGFTLSFLDGLIFISIFLFFITIIPQFAITEGITRSAIALSVAYVLSTWNVEFKNFDSSSLILVSTISWLINIFIPAFLGLMFYHKIFSHK